MKRAVATLAAVVAGSALAACGSGEKPQPAAGPPSAAPSPLAASVPTSRSPSASAHVLVPTPHSSPLTPRSSGPKPPAAPSVRGTDWARMAYPTGCFGATRMVRMPHGTAARAGATLRRGAPAYGDLTGDGVADAVVALTCSRPGAEPADEAVAFTRSPNGPRSLGAVLALSDRQRVQRVLFPRKAQVLVAGLARSPANAAPAPPDQLVSTTWRYDGTALRRVSRFVDPAEVLDPEG